MVRTQVMLSKTQHDNVRSLAHIHRISFAEAVRRLLDRGLQEGLGTGPGKSGAAGLLELAGAASGGPHDLAAEHDRYLDEDFNSS